MQSNKERLNDLSHKAICRNLTVMTPDEQTHLNDGLNAIPERKVIDLSQYLTNVILPQIQRNKGIGSVEYQNFKQVNDALIWALHVMSLQDRMQYQLSNERLLCEFYREKCIYYERELTRYTTMEELTLGETFYNLKKHIVKHETSRNGSATTETV